MNIARFNTLQKFQQTSLAFVTNISCKKYNSLIYHTVLAKYKNILTPTEKEKVLKAFHSRGPEDKYVHPTDYSSQSIYSTLVSIRIEKDFSPDNFFKYTTTPHLRKKDVNKYFLTKLAFLKFYVY